MPEKTSMTPEMMAVYYFSLKKEAKVNIVGPEQCRRTDEGNLVRIMATIGKEKYTYYLGNIYKSGELEIIIKLEDMYLSCVYKNNSYYCPPWIYC
jgi:hypothetical protein